MTDDDGNDYNDSNNDLKAGKWVRQIGTFSRTQLRTVGAIHLYLLSKISWLGVVFITALIAHSRTCHNIKWPITYINFR